jgi:hypothetical protein
MGRAMVRKARLELARVAPPGSKPGASTNSATFAFEQPRIITRRQPAKVTPFAGGTELMSEKRPQASFSN